MMTFAPSAANNRTVPAPRPEAPPVTMNTLPLTCISPLRNEKRQSEETAFFLYCWCRWPESNWRPSHYECAALPTELQRRSHRENDLMQEGGLYRQSSFLGSALGGLVQAQRPGGHIRALSVRTSIPRRFLPIGGVAFSIQA